MKPTKHTSAKASHYNSAAKSYDAFNEKNSQIINKTIERILKKHKIKTVLDLTCGTGSQVFYLSKHGYDVVGSDINTKMLAVAKQKTKTHKCQLQFKKGDMRTTQIGKFDAVITIFNAIGHLTKSDFEKAIRNIYKNLNDDGLYIFDINNLTYLLKDNNITKLTINWQEKTENKIVRDIQYSTINQEGILASYTTSYEQIGSQKPKIRHHAQTLQVYTLKQLKDMLKRNGFKVIQQCETDGSAFLENKSGCVMVVARKI